MRPYLLMVPISIGFIHVLRLLYVRVGVFGARCAISCRGAAAHTRVVSCFERPSRQNLPPCLQPPCRPFPPCGVAFSPALLARWRNLRQPSLSCVRPSCQLEHAADIPTRLSFHVGITPACSSLRGIVRTCTAYSNKTLFKLVHAVDIPTRNRESAGISATCTNAAECLLE